MDMEEPPLPPVVGAPRQRPDSAPQGWRGLSTPAQDAMLAESEALRRHYQARATSSEAEVARLQQRELRLEQDARALRQTAKEAAVAQMRSEARLAAAEDEIAALRLHGEEMFQANLRLADEARRRRAAPSGGVTADLPIRAHTSVPAGSATAAARAVAPRAVSPTRPPSVQPSAQAMVLPEMSASDALDIRDILPKELGCACECVSALSRLPDDAPSTDAVRAISDALQLQTPEESARVRDNFEALPPMAEWLPTLARLCAALERHGRSWHFADTGAPYAPTLAASDELCLSAAARIALRALAFIQLPPTALDHGKISVLRDARVFGGAGGSSTPTAVVMSGPPGSGKSTMLRRVLPWLHTHYGAPAASEYAAINPDLWIEELLANNNDYRPLANYCNHETFLAAVASRHHLLFDGTAQQLKNTCGRVIGRLRRAGYSVHIVVVLASADTCWERIEARRAQIGRGVPRPVFDSILSNVLAVVPTYLRGAGYGLVESATLCINDGRADGEPRTLTSRTASAEIEAAIAAVQQLLRPSDQA